MPVRNIAFCLTAGGFSRNAFQIVTALLVGNLPAINFNIPVGQILRKTNQVLVVGFSISVYIQSNLIYSYLPRGQILGKAHQILVVDLAVHVNVTGNTNHGLDRTVDNGQRYVLFIVFPVFADNFTNIIRVKISGNRSHCVCRCIISNLEIQGCKYIVQIDILGSVYPLNISRTF